MFVTSPNEQTGISDHRRIRTGFGCTFAPDGSIRRTAISPAFSLGSYSGLCCYRTSCFGGSWASGAKEVGCCDDLANRTLPCLLGVERCLPPSAGLCELAGIRLRGTSANTIHLDSRILAYSYLAKGKFGLTCSKSPIGIDKSRYHQ